MKVSQCPLALMVNGSFSVMMGSCIAWPWNIALTAQVAVFTVADSCTTSTISLQAQSTSSAEIGLEITGCNNTSDFPGLTTVARVDLYENSFTELDLAGLRITDQIRIADNPNLERLVLPDPRPGQTVTLPPTGQDAPQWTDVEIVNNPRLDSSNIEYQNSSNFWDWGAQNLSTLVLSGGNFHWNFFYPQSTSTGDYPKTGSVYVTTRFVLNSTDSTFDCSYLNELRYQGALQGDYSCQGRAVNPISASSLGNSRNGLLGGLVVAAWFVRLL
ncbi:hypothetical protein F4677DRAFT_414114 [Hypoxylon crocopeplum]|nr:hypothetical protein F4677DRAFT_414114 [Hypoxylon crocopeplum]